MTEPTDEEIKAKRRETIAAVARKRAAEAASKGTAEAPADGAPETVTIYTDGACSGNPGPGGWGAILLFRGAEKELSGGEAATTNNRMEMMAAIQALEGLKRPCSVDLFTDSQYVRNGIAEWLRGWKAKGWRTAAGQPVKNEDLWRRLDEARTRHQVRWHWVKGHASDPLNNRVDALAVAAMAPFKRRR